jgi:hypothetical protein
MTQSSNKGAIYNKVRVLRRATDQQTGAPVPSEMTWPPIEYNGMRLIPWREIWASLTVAKIRGNGEMIEVFYDTLFKEAIFDDRGAWSLDLKKRI